MDRNERSPLLSSHFSRNSDLLEEDESVKEGSFLLLSMPRNGNRIFVQKLNRICNYSGTTVAACATVSVLLVMIVLMVRSNGSLLSQSTVMQAAPATDTENPSSPSSIIIDIPLGRIRGHSRKSRKGRDYFSFLKVPYAAPPIDDLRFRDPQPARPWNGVRDIPEVASSCIQKSKHDADNVTMGVEDCLYSNIYVPAFLLNSTETSPKKYPVLVNVHGGGFGDGNGSKYGAEYFMDEDVILITYEYRLGLLGFLNTGDREATGNMGFKDQIMMLKWVKQYIKHFNGDENRVTIFGNSAGGFSISFLVISPMGHGLFHRAISQSGTVLCESTNLVDLEPEKTVNEVAGRFNCSTESSIDLLKCLRSLDAKDLALLNSPKIRYALTVEKGFPEGNYTDVFMPEKPYKLMSEGKVNPVPYIMGVVSTEWIGASLGLLTSPQLIDSFNSNFSKLASTLLALDISEEESESIKTFYFGDQLIGNATERNLTNMVSDRVMVHPTKVTGDFHAKVADTYFYVLTKPPAKSYAQKILDNFPFVDKEKIVSHADEIQFQMPYHGYPTYSMEDSEYFPFSEFLVKLWANFAATGKPEIEGKVTDWKSIQGSTEFPLWYELNDISRPTGELGERMQFWDGFTHKKLMFDM